MVLPIYLYKIPNYMEIKNLSGTLKYSFLIAVVLILFGGGFYVGRKTIDVPKEKIKTVYIKGKTIVKSSVLTIPPIPILAVFPADTADIIKKCVEDGIYKELWPKEKEYILPTKEDTLAIMYDWSAKRYYSEKIFDIDTLGTCTINASVQYNRLSELGYEYTPSTKTEIQTIYRVKKFSPFVGAGGIVGLKEAQPHMMMEVNGGMFFNDKYGVQVRYQTAFLPNTNYVGASALFKF